MKGPGGADACGGGVEASLAAAVPYAAWRASERMEVWGAAGHGSGGVTLRASAGGIHRADTGWTMAAAGVRGDILPPPPGGSGPALALVSDALWARTSSEAADGLAASASAVTRLRIGLEGSWHVPLDGGGALAPRLEIGLRHDGGDAETGSGVELGGGLSWNGPDAGMSFGVSGRALLPRGGDGLKDRGFSAELGFDPAPATRRGPSLSLRHDFGGSASGGLGALFAPDPLEGRTGGADASRWTVEAAYGLPAFGGRFTGGPHAGLGISADSRDASVGWRLAPEARHAPDLSFGLSAARRESGSARTEHAVGIEVTARW